MSKLQELINKLCPNGVEFKPLREIGDFFGGLTGKSKEDFIDGNARFISYMNVYSNPALKLDLPDFVKINDGEKQNVVQYGDILFTGSSETPNECGMSSVVTTKPSEPLYLNSFCFGFRLIDINTFNLDFLKHLLRSYEVRCQIAKTANGVTRFNISKKLFANIMIPVPPIEVQEEIVRILDSFSDYAAELQAELQARKQQYEYYRNLLLTFNPSAYGCGTDDEQKDGVTTWEGHNYKIEWKKMGEIGTFIRGKRFVRTDIMEQGVPCIHYGDMYTYYGLYTNNTPTFLKEEKAQKMRFAQKNDIVIVAAGENKDDLGNAVAWLGEKPAAVHDACFIFRSNLYPNYISHICRSHNYHKQIKMFANEAKICSVSGQDLQKVLIPVPEYELQIKIASILDRFETLVNDLTNGLPAEIAAVKDQYEYYRNKLLTFKKLSA